MDLMKPVAAHQAIRVRGLAGWRLVRTGLHRETNGSTRQGEL